MKWKQPARLLILCSIVLLISSLSIYARSTAHASSGTWQQFTYVSSNGTHPYFVYTPANYRAATAVPLIVMLHGCLQTPADFAAGTQMDALADQDQFIVVYPQQTTFYNSAECWNWFLPVDQVRGSGEPAVIAGITETVMQNTAQWTINTQRVYVAGISAGAGMAVIMGASYPDIYAAIGVHSGVEYQATTNPLLAGTVEAFGGPDPVAQGNDAYNEMGRNARVVPTIVFHGNADPVVHPINGDQVVQQWMQTDRDASHGAYTASFALPSDTTNGQVPNGHSYEMRSWNDIHGGEIEEYWTVDGMGHAWSGGSSAGSFTDPRGPSATQAMYTFFINHPL